MSVYNGLRRFVLDRREDVTGVSGTGVVAEGVVFCDGTVALRWRGAHKSSAIYESIEEVEAIHLHRGATVIRWLDPICFACGSMLEANPVLHCFACGAGQGDAPHMETRPDRSLGSWSQALEIKREKPAA